MRDLRITKEADYAIGLPEKGKYTAFPKHDEPTATGFVIQRHAAERAGCFSPDSPVLLANGCFVPIAEISVGVEVCTRFGPRKVKRIWYNGDSDDWFRVITPHGTFYATPNHRFWVRDLGWVAIGFFYEALCRLRGKVHTEEVFEANDLFESLCDQSRLENCSRTRYTGDKEQFTSSEEGVGVQVDGEIPASLRRRVAENSIRNKRAFTGRNRCKSSLLSWSSAESFETLRYPDSARSDFALQGQKLRPQQLELEGWRLQRSSRRDGFSPQFDWMEVPSETDSQRTALLRKVWFNASAGGTSHQALVDCAGVVLRSEQPSLAVQEVPCRSRQDFPRFSCGAIQIQRVSRPGESRYDLEVEGVHEYVVGGLVVHNSHYDLRIQVPGTETGASWAIPKAKLPDLDQHVLAVRQGDHRTDYFGFEGRIPEGYGKGEVTIAHSGPVELLESRPDMVRFALYTGPRSHRGEYLLRQTGGKQWLLRNVTPTRAKAELPNDTQYRYRDVKMQHFEPTEHGIDQAKLDGAHNFGHFVGGKLPRVFSYVKSKLNPSGLIEHTPKLEHLWNGQKVPKELGDTLLRGEVWGRKQNGTPLHPSQVAGLLNSGVWKSRDDQKEIGKLQFSPFDIVRYKGKDVRDLPHHERWELVKEVAKIMGLELPQTAVTAKAKQKMWDDIVAKRHDQTVEGIVRWTEKGPVKLKVRDDVDVPVEGVFAPRPGTKYHGNAAGGIVVKYKGVLTRVGTGFTDAQRRHLYENPELYKGMMARVEIHDITRGDKLRGPSFMGWHPDKNDPDRLEKVVHRGTPKLAELVGVSSEARILG